MPTGQNIVGMIILLVIVVAGVFLADWLKTRITR